MSRIGKLPVSIPEKVEVSDADAMISVSGPKGNLSKRFDDSISVSIKDSEIVVIPANDSRHAQAMQGTARSILANMVQGVTDGFSKELEIKGVGFKAFLKGSCLDLDLGYSHQIEYQIPEGIQITVTDNTKIKVEGTDKQLVGEVAATIKRYYPVEPYKGKGVRIIGEFVRRKEGKKTA